MKHFITFFVALSAAVLTFGQTYPYQNPDLDPQTRAEDLLGRLTLE